MADRAASSSSFGGQKRNRKKRKKKKLPRCSVLPPTRHVRGDSGCFACARRETHHCDVSVDGVSHGTKLEQSRASDTDLFGLDWSDDPVTSIIFVTDRND